MFEYFVVFILGVILGAWGGVHWFIEYMKQNDKYKIIPVGEKERKKVKNIRENLAKEYPWQSVKKNNN